MVGALTLQKLGKCIYQGFIYLSESQLLNFLFYCVVFSPVFKLLSANHWYGSNYARNYGTGNLSDPHFIILPGLQLLDDTAYSGAGNPMAKYIFPCLFCYEKGHMVWENDAQNPALENQEIYKWY